MAVGGMQSVVQSISWIKCFLAVLREEQLVCI